MTLCYKTLNVITEIPARRYRVDIHKDAVTAIMATQTIKYATCATRLRLATWKLNPQLGAMNLCAFR